ncbi:MAG: metal-dependent hydrolase [Aggregatilineales bacterium]
MALSFTWYGHSTFSLDIDGYSVLIDPFLTDNPLTTTSPDDLNPDLILLSHAHGDHVADAMGILQRTGATVVCNFEMGNWYAANGLPQEQIFQGNPGGSYRSEQLDVKFTKAFHSSSFPDGSYGGQPNGFIITIQGKKLYFAGDTSLFGDMKLIGEENIYMAFLPIGDVFTMGVEDSVRAVKLLGCKYVVPMHYNTFPPITQDAGAWAELIHRNTSADPIVLDPGKSHNL